MKRTIIVSVLGLVLTGVVLAQSGHKMKMGMNTRNCHQKMMKNHSCQSFDLNDDQQEKITQLKTDHLKDIKSTKDKLAEKRVKLHTLRTAEKVDTKAVNSLIEEIGKLQVDLMKKQEALHQQIRRLLTEEQRIRLDNRHMSSCGMNMHAQGKHHMKMSAKHNWDNNNCVKKMNKK